MDLLLKRYRHKPWGIDAELYCNGLKICDTVEHPTLHRPVGTYTIERTNHPFIRGDGPMRATKGQIIVGRHALSGMVKHSALTYAKLYDRMKKAWHRSTPITLTIEDLTER